ncbi:hypothetical protein ALO41_200122 [Pseudomonas amygdali pv. ulmi]|uniref:DNA polymerase V subunit UmuC n=1 Tax=Pseudomonas amygdali pv. ulmi TaxID=251720 RepID=A0A0N8TDX2_PSEA0|nr:alpha/beta hydrolase [Pseudomonas amygdali]KPZ14785.1 hypothetical protein ALO41_200122 [Pseudomonas amygdali pv. ulmi]KWS07278.1 hypothetical protein AL065_08700 [Pseudomonas amygdali pv. ulmi]
MVKFFMNANFLRADVLIKYKFTKICLLLMLSAWLVGCNTLHNFSSSQAALREQIEKIAPSAAVTDLKFRSLADSGMLVNGQLNGRDFSLRFPFNWNKQVLLFAHGYKGIDGIKPDQISADPLDPDPSIGILQAAYNQGFAVGHSAYAKRGLAVSSGVERTVALKRLTDMIGSTRAYVSGGSMGGGIAVLISQRYPNDFAGALSICGAVSDWTYEVDYATNVRNLYNYFSHDTPYALPGSQDVTHSVAGVGVGQFLKPLLKLQADARMDSQGTAAKIIKHTLSALPNVRTEPDFASIVSPILIVATGMDDINSEVGGIPIDNSTTKYHSPFLTKTENAKLNASVQRYKADPGARERMTTMMSSTGEQRTKLLTIHNAYDSLAPYEHAERLRERISEAGYLANLVQQTVPTVQFRIDAPYFFASVLPYAELLNHDLGAAHCGFTHEQMSAAWDSLRLWVEIDQRPAESSRVNLLR